MAVDENTIREVIKGLKDSSKKRNFTQSFDLIINLSNLNLKKPEEQVNLYVQLPKSRGNKARVCALVGHELKQEAEKACDKTITQDEFDAYANDKKALKKLAKDFNFFIAQANIMPKVASSFGKVFGPKKKMPDPKSGCVVPPGANLKPVYDKLQSTVRLYAKEKPLIQVPVGSEEMDDKDIADNVLTVYDNLIHHLPLEKNNIKSIYLKLTMSKPVIIK